MAARIEFIPYGKKWEPKVLIVRDEQQITLWRRPNYKRLQFVTPIIISASHADVTIVDHILPGESAPHRDRLRSDSPALIIHRAAILSHPDTARGTIRISHMQREEDADGSGDREPIGAPDLDPDTVARLLYSAAHGDQEPVEIIN